MVNPCQSSMTSSSLQAWIAVRHSSIVPQAAIVFPGRHHMSTRITLLLGSVRLVPPRVLRRAARFRLTETIADSALVARSARWLQMCWSVHSRGRVTLEVTHALQVPCQSRRTVVPVKLPHDNLVKSGVERPHCQITRQGAQNELTIPPSLAFGSTQF